MNRDVRTTREFDRGFKRLPSNVKRTFREKLALFLADPAHPSLRVKRVRSVRGVWEMSVTMKYRLTFELTDEFIILRRIGTHDVLRNP